MAVCSLHGGCRAGAGERYRLCICSDVTAGTFTNGLLFNIRERWELVMMLRYLI